VTAKQNSSLGIVFILGLLAMLMPLSIDMYLPALPVISAQFNVPDGSAQMTLSTYILGFAWASCCMARWRTASGVSR
jgi:DHA1 family bicyclomycin/chloramphenicol resistance-like MFS transporter